MHSRHPTKATKKLKVGFLLARHFTLSALSLFVDTLRLAGDFEDRSRRVLCDWDVLSSSQHTIRSSCGIQVCPTNNLADPGSYDYIAVVGGLLSVEEPFDRAEVQFLQGAARNGVPLIGLCTGSFVLARNGLLENRMACVSWLHHQTFKDNFPAGRVTSHQIFVEDRGVITCAGGSAVADLAAFLVRRHIGLQAEKNALEILQIERRRTGGELQSRLPIVVPSRHDRRIRASLLYMEQQMDDRVDIEGIARKVGISRRHLERIFSEKAGISPKEALVQIRMQKAHVLIEQTSRLIIDIALDVGFESSSHFSQKFRKTFGITPTELRKSANFSRMPASG